MLGFSCRRGRRVFEAAELAVEYERNAAQLAIALFADNERGPVVAGFFPGFDGRPILAACIFSLSKVALTKRIEVTRPMLDPVHVRHRSAMTLLKELGYYEVIFLRHSI